MMRLGPPPPPAIVPVDPLMVIRPLSETCSSEADRARDPSGSFAAGQTASPHAHHHAHHVHHVHHGASFRPATSGKALGMHGAKRTRLKRRRKSSAAGAGPGIEHAEIEEWDWGESGDDYDARRLRAAYALHTDSSQRDDAERGNRDEGHRLERHFAAIRGATDDLSQRTPGASGIGATRDAGVGALDAAMASEAPLTALASVLSRQLQSSAGVATASLASSLLMHAARGWLQAQGPGASGGGLTLSQVRSALLATPSRAGAGGTRTTSPLVWLPVFLLNLDKPRTPSQREQAIERLDMLDRLARGRQVGR